MKKAIRLLAAMLMVLVLVLTFVACNDADEPTTPDTTPDTHTTHTAGADWQKDATRHWHACTGNGCTEKLDVADHVFDNACDIDCNVCGATRTINHTAGATWIKDATHHWHACETIGCEEKLDIAEHSFVIENDANPEYYVEETETAHIYYKSCACGAKGTETFEVAKTVATLENVQMPVEIIYGDNYFVNYTTNSNGQVTFEWYRGSKQLVDQPVDVGNNYKVKVIIEGTTEFTAVESDLIPFEIKPRTISGFSTNVTYNTSNVHKIDVSYSYPGVECEVTFDRAGAGASIVSVKVFENEEETSNYVVDMDSFNVSLVPATVTVQWTAPTSLKFDGLEKEPSAALVGVYPGDECFVQMMLDGDNVWYGSTFKYVVIGLDGTDADNYVLPLNGNTCTSPTYTVEDFPEMTVGTDMLVYQYVPYGESNFLKINLEEGIYIFDFCPDSQSAILAVEIYKKGNYVDAILDVQLDYTKEEVAFVIEESGEYFVKCEQVNDFEPQYDTITIIVDEHASKDAYGFCAYGCGTYLGTTLTTNTWESVTITSGKKVFIRFADAGDVGYAIKFPTADDKSGLNIKCYRTDNNGNFEEVSLSEERTEFVGSFDGYYYISIGFFNLNGGEKSFTFQIEQTEF